MHDEKVQVANEILQYLIDHPKAQDTAEGIVRWWFLKRTVEPQESLVEYALKSLVEEGLVIKHKRSDTYKINRRRRKEILARLQGRS